MNVITNNPTTSTLQIEASASSGVSTGSSGTVGTTAGFELKYLFLLLGLAAWTVYLAEAKYGSLNSYEFSSP
jgi:hypothetical protein